MHQEWQLHDPLRRLQVKYFNDHRLKESSVLTLTIIIMILILIHECRDSGRIISFTFLYHNLALHLIPGSMDAIKRKQSCLFWQRTHLSRTGEDRCLLSWSLKKRTCTPKKTHTKNKSFWSAYVPCMHSRVPKCTFSEGYYTLAEENGACMTLPCLYCRQFLLRWTPEQKHPKDAQLKGQNHNDSGTYPHWKASTNLKSRYGWIQWVWTEHT